MRGIILLCALLTLSACNQSNTNNANTGNNSNTNSTTNNTNSARDINNANSANKSDAARTKADFSTPKAAIDTFISAAANRDADLLSTCFDEDSPKEFQKFRDKTASQKDLDELATFVKSARVTGIEQSGNAAEVSVQFNERNEQIAMKKTSEGWKIVDF